MCIFIAISFGDNLYSYFPTRHVFILSDRCKDVRVSRITSWFALEGDASAGGILKSLHPPFFFFLTASKHQRSLGGLTIYSPAVYLV